MKQHNFHKYTLDNAAKIYPAAMTKKWNSVFRISVYLKSIVDVEVLEQAVIDLAPRFPSFYVQLHKGLFWDTLVKVDNYDIVEPDTQMPCRPFTVAKGDKPLFRVLYSGNRIAVEFFHSITDGTGATVYLKTLTAHYLELQGFTIEKTNGVLDVNDAPKSYETEDAFQSVYRKAKRISRKESNAYQYTPEKTKNYLRAVSGLIRIGELKKVAERYNCTITAYLAGVYAYTFLEQYRIENNGADMNKPVKISIPVNLRPYFEKDTLRNFASFVNVSVYPNENKTLADTIATVKAEMQNLIQIEKIEKTVSQNVAEEKMLITKIAPNVLKKLVMKFCFYQYGEKKYTAPLSNLGYIKVPNSMKEHIERFDFIIGETVINRVYCTAIGFDNMLTVTLSSVTEDTVIEDRFFEILSADGVAFETSAVTKAA